MGFVNVASVDDVLVGKTFQVGVKDIDILLVNVKGTVYAVCDKCGHQNDILSKGTLFENIITCPLNHVQFDVTTGKMIPAVVDCSPPGIDQAPKEMQDATKAIDEMATQIRTHNLRTFQAKIEGKRVYVNL